jgi:hypothetical protein
MSRAARICSVRNSGSEQRPGRNGGPTHRDLDARSLAMHRLIAEKLRRDPGLLAHAQATLERWRARGDPSTRVYDDEWARALRAGLTATLRLMLDESEHGDALRQCSPLACILTAGERFEFLRAWKASHVNPDRSHVGTAAALQEAADEWLRTHPGDPRPTLVAYGAPMLVPAKKEMPLEEAVAKSLALLREDPTVICSLPVVLDHAAETLDPAALRRSAEALRVASELGMVLDLTAELTGAERFRLWAGELAPHPHAPVYLTRDRVLSEYARRFTDERTPDVVRRWGFRLNFPLPDLKQFFEKHRCG